MKAPLNIQLEITNACNHKCEYCYNYDRFNKDYLTKENADKILDVLGDDIFEITLTGGEPLLNKSTLFYILEKCEDKNIDTYLNTNLTLLRCDDIDKLRNLEGILASFPSYNKETYNKITNSRNYDKFLSNLERVKENIPVGVNMTVTQSNKKDIYATGKFLHDSFDFDYFSATPIIKTSEFHRNLGLSKGEVVGLVDDLVRLHEDFDMDVDSLENIPSCRLPKKYREAYRFSNRSCSAGITNILVDSMGMYVLAPF